MTSGQKFCRYSELYALAYVGMCITRAYKSGSETALYTHFL
jgi:hypothetical protein